jgi:hypothetical protein
MADKKKKKAEIRIEEMIEFEVKAGIEFVKRFHPRVWQTVDHDDIGKILAIAHVIYKVRPDLIEATEPGCLPYIQ